MSASLIVGFLVGYCVLGPLAALALLHWFDRRDRRRT